jgi:hypothetical protein
MPRQLSFGKGCHSFAAPKAFWFAERIIAGWRSRLASLMRSAALEIDEADVVPVF